MTKILIQDEELNQVMRCVNYKQVNEDFWQRYFKGLREEAERYIDLRKHAIDGEVFTNQTLPEHIFIKEVS